MVHRRGKYAAQIFVVRVNGLELVSTRVYVDQSESLSISGGVTTDVRMRHSGNEKGKPAIEKSH